MIINPYLYVVVTGDVYELPLAVSDSSSELGSMLGKNAGAIRKTAERGALSHERFNGYRYRILRVDNDIDWEEYDDE